MNNELTDKELSNWFSTYGMITAERLLERYSVKLPPMDLYAAIKNTESFYHNLLRVPLKNVLNGIILQQANDYHIYAQKLFIDYLLSGESNKEEDAQGFTTREAIEHERQQLLTLGDEFNELQERHSQVIAISQKALIQTTKKLHTEQATAINDLQGILTAAGFTVKKSKIRQAINHALIHCDRSIALSESIELLFNEKINEFIKASISADIKGSIREGLTGILEVVQSFYDTVDNYMDKSQEITQSANSFRNQFFSTILRVIELIKLLPDYKIDPEQDEINREPLYFDKNIGSIV